MKAALAAFALYAALASGRAGAQGAEGTPGAAIPAVAIRDSINIGTVEYIDQALRAAHDWQSPALLIELDTPGGFLEATREIVQTLLLERRPPLRVIIWVTPAGARAASAGSMITLAADYAAMSPGTSIGAATPVSASGEKVPEDMRAKLNNDTVSFVDGIARQRGRNVEWARDSVTKAASLTAGEALRMKVIDGVHASREEVWAGARKKFPELPAAVVYKEVRPDTKASLLSFLSNPNIAYGLMTVGAIGIYTEMTHPGLVVPGAVGVISMALGAMTMKILPIRPGALILFAVGLILMIVELLTPLPTHGMAGFGGAVALLLSGIFLMDASRSDLHLTPSLWLPVFFVTMGFMVFLGAQAAKALRSKSYKQGAEALVGLVSAVVTVRSREEATVMLNGELWKAQWDSAAPATAREAGFTKDLRVRVVHQRDLVVLVVPETEKV